MDFLYSVIGFLIAIAILVAVHEFGHYWVAKKLGVKVLRYCIGFGKPLYTVKRGPDQTEYMIAAIPLGGYVKMLDEGEGNVDPSERHRAFNVQPIWKRSLIVMAGPAINFLFAIVAFFVLGLLSTQQLPTILGHIQPGTLSAQAGLQKGDQLMAIDGKPYHYFHQHNLYIFNQVLKHQDIELDVRRLDGGQDIVHIATSTMPIYQISPAALVNTLGLMPESVVTTTLDVVVDDSPAQQAGLLAGDKILSIDGEPTGHWRALVEKISAAVLQPLTVKFQRGESVREVIVTPKIVEREGKQVGQLGIKPFIDKSKFIPFKHSFGASAKYAVENTWLMSSVTLRMLGKMITGQVSHKNISGPISIAEVAGQAIQIGLDYYLHILAVVSISLGVMNLLPIPMLDGGHLLMYVIEAVAGKTNSEKAFAVGQRIGVFLLLCLMSLAFYNDIFRLLN